MRGHIFALIAVVMTISQLTGCVVYDRPYPYRYHYYHWWYR